MRARYFDRGLCLAADLTSEAQHIDEITVETISRNNKHLYPVAAKLTANTVLLLILPLLLLLLRERVLVDGSYYRPN